MKRILLIAASYTLLAAVLLYAGDYLSLRYRIPNGREQFSSVMVQRTYAVPMKDRKTDYMFDPPAPQTCVNSLFPHFGNPPCWYLNRHKVQQVTVGERSDSAAGLSAIVVFHTSYPARCTLRYDGGGAPALRPLCDSVVARLHPIGYGAEAEVRRADHRRYSVRSAGATAGRRGIG